MVQDATIKTFGAQNFAISGRVFIYLAIFPYGEKVDTDNIPYMTELQRKTHTCVHTRAEKSTSANANASLYFLLSAPREIT